MAALLVVDFLDELTSGVPVLGAPDIRRDLSLPYTGAAWVLLALPLALGAIVEAPLLLRADRWPRKRTIAITLALQSLATLAAAFAPSATVLGVSLAIWGSAAGITIGVAQSSLVEAFPAARERILTRAALLSAIGDAAAPVLVGGVHALGGSWRTALAALSALYATHAIVVTLAPAVGGARSDEADPPADPIRSALRSGLLRRILPWLLATAACCLLDETLVAFGSLHLRERLGASPTHQAAAFAAFAIGASFGLVVSDRLLARAAPMRLLAASSALCLAAYATWLAAPSVAASVPLLAVVGMTAAPMYPIALAQAYAACPDRPGLVAAFDKLLAPVEVALPLAIGLCADLFGLSVALAVLAVEPAFLLVLALVKR